MEIRRILRGMDTGFAARPAPKGKDKPAESTRPNSDRVELSRQWVESMEERRAQTEAALLAGSEEKKPDSILDMLDQPSAEEQELDAMSQQLKVQQKCLEIAMRIMRGKRVPPEDEQYLMENDPEGYKLAMASRVLAKEDDEECESVLDEEDKKSSETAGTGRAVPAEGGEVPSGGGDAPSSGGGEVE